MSIKPLTGEEKTNMQQQAALALAERNELFALATSYCDAAKTATLNELSTLKANFDRLQDLEERFKKQNLILKKCNLYLPDPEKHETSQPFIEFMRMISTIEGKYFQLKATEPPPTPSVSAQSPPVIPTPVTHLPKIQIPKFDGKLSEWPNFHALFNSLVHENRQISNTVKFQYLKSSLTDEAASVISSFHLTDANYEIAFAALTARYNNPRQIAHMYIKKIMEYKHNSSNSLSELKQFMATHENSVNALKALALDDLSDFLLVSLALRNLDSKTRHFFEVKHDSAAIPTFQNLLNFVNHQIKTIETSQLTGESSSKKHPSPKSHSYLAQTTPQDNKPSSKPVYALSCILCSRPHHIARCDTFSKMSISSKYDTLKQHQRCFNCLGHHLKTECTSTSTCQKCGSNQHHTLLHKDRSSNNMSASNPAAVNNVSSDSSSKLPPVTLSCTSAQSIYTLLGTFQACVVDCFGVTHPIRGVIDPGSQVSFVCSSIVQSLRLPSTPSSMSVSGIGSSDTSSSSMVSIQLASRYSKQRVTLRAAVLKSISPQIPAVNIPPARIAQFKRFRLADPKFHLPGKIDILLGADVFPRLLLPSSIKPSQYGPVALNTLFGHVIVGPIALPPQGLTLTSLLSTSEVDKQLTKFWDVESVHTPPPSDPLDDIAEHHFTSTAARTSSGRYIVALPFAPSSTPLGYNSKQAKASLVRLESRLSKQPAVVSAYKDFMSEYLSSGHMEPASAPSSYVIPHHMVTKETNQGPKVRVVFNASSPDDSGISLNERLLKGPKLQQDLSHVLLHFRLHSIAVCCDIKQMYRQILVQPEHRQYQHIFWRPSNNVAVQEMQLNTVTYGMAPSAFLAVRVLHQLVRDEGHKFPLASHALLHNSYVDDIISGAPDLDTAKLLRSQLTDLLALGHFQLRKWSSSHPDVLHDLPSDHLDCPLLFSDPEKTLKILGLNWEPSSDSFLFRVSEFTGTCTKRTLLSFIARIFDPNGFLTPITFALKSMLQQLWLSRLDWDQPVTTAIQDRWFQLTQHLSLLANVRISRHVHCPPSSSLSLIGFADASLCGYAAVVYLCVESPSSRNCTLWKARSRVAPLKTLSIPRLELCAALLLSELIDSLLRFSYPIPLSSIRLFSDSQIVLSWLDTSPHLLKTFVSHRVARIKEISFHHLLWSHVASELNPADMASRGLTPESFSNEQCQQLWFCGPPFANQPDVPWPAEFVASTSKDLLPELRTTPPLSLIVSTSSNFLHELLSRFSQLNKARRVLAWVLRFASNCRIHDPTQRHHGDLSVSELQSAMTLYVKSTQADSFAEEIQRIKSQKVTKSLQSLTPYLDSLGVVRVGGRLSRSRLSQDAQHPILLPKDSHLSLLIARHVHLLCLHAGPNTCIARVRSEYWIMSIRRLIRSVIASCRTCKLFRARTPQPVMSDLPAIRVVPGRPFLNTGVDFAGPFQVKSSRLRRAPITKGYLCLFVCMATKAIHLELTSELSTASFLAAFDRFIARRGLPHSMSSDRGTNFVGASHALKEASEFILKHQSEISSHLSSHNIQWHFNPPCSPNFGGIWEAGVKSAKNILVRIAADLRFTSEEYFTLFARIEAILNSRPLCPLSSDPEESSDYLSPGHFLVGAPLLARPELPLPQNFSLTDRWKAISHLTRQFWDRWSREYLNCLMQRHKWARPSDSLSVGDVVFVKNTISPPLHWPIARVEHLHPGPDGITRVVTLRNSSGPFVRPVNRLVPLDAQ